MINIPAWTPEFIRPIVQQMDRNPACFGPRRVAFEQLVNDRRMSSVYDELLKRDRQTGDFLYPAKHRANDQSTDDAQQVAIQEVLQLAVTAASDRMSVSKLEQLEEAKKRWGDIAGQLRGLAHDMELAAELGMLGLSDPVSKTVGVQDLQSLRRVANWVDHLTSAMRQPGDPLIVERHRGDPVVRGVQILVGVKLEEQLGQRLDGTAATLTSVVLGAETTPRVSRSALTQRKPEKRRSPS